MSKFFRWMSILGLMLLLSACRESIPGKYSHQEQFAEEIEQTLAASLDPSLVETHEPGVEPDTENEVDHQNNDEVTEATEASDHEIEPEHETEQATEPENTTHEQTVHWSYSGDTGPDHWGAINPEYALCGTGSMQSPVDIHQVEMANMPEIKFTYQPSLFTVVNTGHSIQVNFAEGNSIEMDGTAYQLKQLHFHGPSEHTIEGQYLSMEMHMVHQDSAGNYAVIAVFIQTGADNPAFQSIWENMPEQEGGENQPEGISLDPGLLLPVDRSYYFLEGSLTTPPCTEGVKWYIYKTPINLSVMQIAQIEAIYINNIRPIQPINDRVIHEQGN